MTEKPQSIETIFDLTPDSRLTALGDVVPVNPDRFEVKLPSGAKAQVLKRGKGKHVSLASRMAGGQAGIPFIFAMIAVKVQYEGRDLTVEDVEELPDHDVLELIGLTMNAKMAADARAMLTGEAAPKKAEGS